jgi:PAS domain S-box-containing protein
MQNDALEQIYGYSMEELNQIDQYVTYINPEDRDHLLKRLKQDGFLRAFEVAKKRRDGTVYYVNITMVPFPTMGEGYYLTMLVDITERKKTEQQLRALTARLAEVETAERKRLARELHDQVGQSLTALGINLNIAKAQMPGEGMNLARSRLDDALALVKSTTQSIRDVMNDLRPPMLDAYGLLETLQWYGEQFAARTMIDVVVQGEEPNPRFPAMVENSLFRIVQEALINTAKHAGAQQVIVVVNERDDTLRLTIIDDGIGFNAHKSIQPTDQQGWGLLIMTERAEGIGGQFNLQSSLGEGTKITVEVPR